MSQPVVDTLELCDALRKTGMEHDQAEGVARALGKELGEHVVTQGDLQVGFEQVRGELQAARAETRAAFQQARAELQASRAETQAAFQQAQAETQAAFQQAHAETQAAFQQARAERQAVDHKVDLLGGRIDSLQATLKTTFTGVALAIAFLALVTGAGIFRTAAPGSWDGARAPAVPAPPPAMVDTAPPNV